MAESIQELKCRIQELEEEVQELKEDAAFRQEEIEGLMGHIDMDKAFVKNFANEMEKLFNSGLSKISHYRDLIRL